TVAQYLGSIGFAAVVNFAVVLLLIHVVLRREWPPYKAVLPGLVMYAGIATILATAAVSVRYGMWGDIVGCYTAACLAWVCVGGLFSCGLLRVYRYHDVLVRHSGVMLSSTLQARNIPFLSCGLASLAMLLLPFAVGPFLLLLRPGDAPDPTFDTVAGECVGFWQEADVYEWVAFGVYAATALLLTFRLRVARIQAPHEFKAATATSMTLALVAIALPVIDALMAGTIEGAESDGNAGVAIRRRRMTMLIVTALAGVGVVGASVFRPVAVFISKGDDFNASGDYGFEERPEQPDKVKQLCMQSQINRASSLLRSGDQDSPTSSSAVEFSCYSEMVARDHVEDYFLLQAATMRILATYFREDAPVTAPLSVECRSSTLKFRASSAFIFGRAREEILGAMAGEHSRMAPRVRPRTCSSIMLNKNKKRNGSANSSTSNETDDRSGTTQAFVGNSKRGRDSVRRREGSARSKDYNAIKIDKRRKRLAAAAGGAATGTAPAGKAAKSAKGTVGIENFAEAFGLREDKEGDNRSLGGGSSYTYESSASKHHSVTTTGGGSALDGGDGSTTGGGGGNTKNEHDLKQASSVIVNPIFGDKSRAKGRRPR
ncbi:unnamed protein product, partial [Scytosiphon promiscuus]